MPHAVLGVMHAYVALAGSTSRGGPPHSCSPGVHPRPAMMMARRRAAVDHRSVHHCFRAGYHIRGCPRRNTHAPVPDISRCPQRTRRGRTARSSSWVGPPTMMGTKGASGASRACPRLLRCLVGTGRVGRRQDPYGTAAGGGQRVFFRARYARDFFLAHLLLACHQTCTLPQALIDLLVTMM